MRIIWFFSTGALIWHVIQERKSLIGGPMCGCTKTNVNSGLKRVQENTQWVN